MLTKAITVSLLVALGFWVYGTAYHHASQGDFPLADSLLFFLLVFSWWWAGPEAFGRHAPFEVPSIISERLATSEMRPEVPKLATLKKRVFWTAASCICWYSLEWLAADTARAASLQPAPPLMLRYAISSWAFLAFLLFWIVGFPVFHSPGEEVPILASPRLRLFGRPVLIVVALLIAWYGINRTQELLHDQGLSAPEKFHVLQALLVRVIVVVYILFAVRRFLPMIASPLSLVIRNSGTGGPEARH